VDQYNDKESTTVEQQKSGNSGSFGTVGERLQFLFALAYPPRWDLKRELGERFLSLGAAASALQVSE
jgi:hypothetical protein